MKLIFSVLIVLATTQALAANIYLNPGESIQTETNRIFCGEIPAQKPDVKWWCACFDPNGKNLGQVWGIWAPEVQQTVERVGKRVCEREKNQRIGSVSCFKQNF